MCSSDLPPPCPSPYPQDTYTRCAPALSAWCCRWIEGVSSSTLSGKLLPACLPASLPPALLLGSSLSWGGKSGCDQDTSYCLPACRSLALSRTYVIMNLIQSATVVAIICLLFTHVFQQPLAKSELVCLTACLLAVGLTGGPTD